MTAQSHSSFRLRAEIVPERIPACPAVGAAVLAKA